jgi:hypothetical protein
MSSRVAWILSYAEGARPLVLRAGVEFGFSLVDHQNHWKQVSSE